jgi:hypothetical protein
MLHCSQLSQMPAGPIPRWISAATKLVGPISEIETGEVRLIDFKRSFHFR